MTQPPPLPSDQEFIEVFSTPDSGRSLAYLSLAGGAGLILAGVGGFFLALRTSPNMFQFQTMTTIPMLLAMGLLASAFRTLRGPREVRLSGQGLQIVDQRSRVREWPWEQIAFVQTGTTAMSSQRNLTLHGVNGKPLAKLTHNLEQFDEMVEAIRRRIAEHPAPARTNAQVRKARKTGVFLMAGGVVAWGLGGANLWMSFTDGEARQLLQDRGVPAVATVVEKVIAPDGRTHRIYYRVTDSSGKADTANVEVRPRLWEELKVGMTIDVIAVPGRPDISRLASGQIEDHLAPAPGMMRLVSVVVLAIGAVFFAAGVLNWRGLDLRFDTKTGFRLKKKFGE